VVLHLSLGDVRTQGRAQAEPPGTLRQIFEPIENPSKSFAKASIWITLFGISHMTWTNVRVCTIVDAQCCFGWLA
jgi:hypothetical protein